MPSILTIPAAAQLIGMPRNTLWVWVQTLPEWSGCVSHKSGNRTYLSTDRLRARGFLGVRP